MSYDRIRYQTDDAGVATITLDRPEKRNALDGRTVAELRGVLAEAARDESVRVLVLRGEGPDFCAGADLAQLEAMAGEGDPLRNLADARELGDLFIEMRRHPLPIVAAVQGNAIAGGAGLATACDLVLAREDSVFGYPEVHLGFVPAMVMAILRRSVSEKVAFELVARGERITAAEAERLGLVNRVLGQEGFEDEVREYVAGLAARSSSAVRLIKRLLYGMDGPSFEEAIGRGAEVNVLARMTDDARDGVRRFLKRNR
ncbi:MAG TPA: enoyl-CoA hydratase-related protein [Longimicrobiales bacterium]|nr:enoyl-CoA hydratase-related protein [Longimicrobiales bacterium]